MPENDPSKRKKLRGFLRGALALVCGILVGVILAVGQEMWDLFWLWLQHKQTAFMTRLFWARVYLEFAFAYAIGIALVASLVWWAIGPRYRRHLASAVGLGFILTSAAWLVSELNILEYAYTAAALYGVMGAFSGAVTWWISHPRRISLFVAMARPVAK
ncbi:MAG: hypothetical protein WCA81_07410 [Rhizomicrobium sp.]